MTTKSEMPFLEHLTELRTSLIHTLSGISIATIITYYWSDLVFSILTHPIRENFQDIALIGTGPAEAFMVKIKAAFISGALLSSPYSFLQLWKFISPGLHENEKKFAKPFVFFTTFFFLAGVVFCYYAVFPFTFQFFREEYSSIGVAANIKIGEYLSFVSTLLLVFGVVFELPVLSYILARLGLLTHTWLIAKVRFIIVGIFVAAGVLTPPDVISQLLLAMPLLFFYGLCILVTYWVNLERTNQTN